MGWVQDGILYLRYKSDFTITKAEHGKAFMHKYLYYSNVESAPRLLLAFLKVVKIVRKNMHFVLLLLLSFFLSFSSHITQKL